MINPTHSEVLNFAESSLLEKKALLNESEARQSKSCYHKAYQIEIIILKLTIEALQNPPLEVQS